MGGIEFSFVEITRKRLCILARNNRSGNLLFVYSRRNDCVLLPEINQSGNLVSDEEREIELEQI